MTSIYWLESFSEEEETVKRVSEDLEGEILFREEPVQAFEPDFFEENSIVSVRTHSRFGAGHADRIDCVISRSTGYDHLLDQAEVLEDLVVGSLSKYATEAVADHNLAVAFSLARQLPQAEKALEGFDRNGLTGRELTSFTPGIVGVGRIGSTTAQHLLNLGLEVLGHDLEPRPRLAASDRFTYTSLENVFEQCNLVFLCLPHNDSTRKRIDADLLGRLPDGSLLVNAGRGEVVANRVLLEELNQGSISGIGLDVFNREEALRSHLREHSLGADADDSEIQAALNLIRDDRVLATPHNAFNSRQSVENKVNRTLENIALFRNEGRVQKPVFNGEESEN